MRPIVSSLCLLAASTLGASAAITIYNQNQPPDATGLPGGGWGNYKGFGVSFSDATLSVDYAAPFAEPLPTTLLLTDMTVRRAGTAGGFPLGTPADVVLKVYSSQTPTVSTWVGDSINSANMAGGIEETNVGFAFANLALDPGATYWFYFANAEETGNLPIEEITFASGRLRVSNVAGVTYPSGNLINGADQSNWNVQDGAFDAVFAATFIPEPSTALLGALGALGLLRRRR